MKIKVLVAVVSIVSLTWLGGSFATPSGDPAGDVVLIGAHPEPEVAADHPDSHRLGVLPDEAVELPAWEASGIGPELALVAVE